MGCGRVDVDSLLSFLCFLGVVNITGIEKRDFYSNSKGLSKVLVNGRNTTRFLVKVMKSN